jgi:hypothetical protein
VNSSRPIVLAATQHHALLLVHAGIQLKAVEDQERFHRRVPDALVAVHEGMVLDQREGQRRRLLHHGWVEFLSAEGHLRLGDG